jgi:hypothetical protein
MTYSPKSEIMEVFKQFPNEELSSMEFYKRARDLGIFIPPAFNTHLSQLLKRGDIVKIKRSVYKYMPGIETPKEEPKEMPGFEGTLEALDQLSLL